MALFAFNKMLQWWNYSKIGFMIQSFTEFFAADNLKFMYFFKKYWNVYLKKFFKFSRKLRTMYFY